VADFYQQNDGELAGPIWDDRYATEAITQQPTRRATQKNRLSSAR